MKHAFLAGCLFALAVSAAEPSIYHDGWIDLDKNGKKDIYEDPAQPVQKRVADLLKRMTLAEKIGSSSNWTATPIPRLISATGFAAAPPVRSLAAAN